MISAVIPVWNGRDKLERLFDTMDRQTLAFGEVIVVDNGSQDGAGDLALDRGATVIRFAENRGFAAGVNRGVDESRGELIAVLNSDVELAPDWASVLEGAFSTPSVYFATGRALSLRQPDKIDGCWDLVSRAGMPWRAGSGAPADHPAFQNSRTIDMASFTAVLLRRELWKQIGPLDERFESYLEDVDFGLRCVAERVTGLYDPMALCFHHGSATLGRWNRESVRRMSRNQVFLARKHLASSWWTLLVGQGLWGLMAFRHGAGLAWLQGKREGWFRRQEFAPNAIDAGPLEAQIFQLQSETGFDPYWRWYARLTGQKDTGRARG